VNRTDRLYALVEELRAISPRCRSARELARRFEVSSRTIERDISALQQSGVPIYAEPGRRGGYALDPAMSLPPLKFSPAEAVAVAVALGAAGGQPFADHARSALRKLIAAMPGAQEQRTRELAARVGFILSSQAPGCDVLESAETGRGGPAPFATKETEEAIEEALVRGDVLAIDYADRQGVATSREIEPGLFLGGSHGVWYLVAWCRLRDQVRLFRLDRVLSARPTGERAPRRSSETFAAGLADEVPGRFMLATVLDRAQGSERRAASRGRSPENTDRGLSPSHEIVTVFEKFGRREVRRPERTRKTGNREIEHGRDQHRGLVRGGQ
jgi:predicted DNA-binding transcriptional regulator YafY